MGKLICHNLTARKGAFTLDIPHLEIAGGEKIAVLGENGSGKTTLLQALAGLWPVDGEILLGHARWDRLSARERAACMSYLPQETEVLFNLTVGEILALSLYPGKALAGEERQDVLEALEMSRFEARTYASLSGGEKRRAMLARIFCREAHFILLDEPTASLDMRHAAMFMRHAAGSPATVIAAVHDLNLGVRHFERFLLMKGGRILFDRDKEELDDAELEEIYGINLVRDGTCYMPAC